MLLLYGANICQPTQPANLTELKITKSISFEKLDRAEQLPAVAQADLFTNHISQRTIKMTDKTVGIIGVGLMGQGIAINIQKHGWKIGFLHHEGNQPTDELVAAGAAKFQTLSELALASDIIILCVTGSPEVEQIITGSDGLLASLKKDTVIIDCSTAVPASTIKLAASIKAAGGRFLDAPMTRTPKEAAKGKLNLIVGGDKDLFNEQLPLLQTYAENIVHAGDTGAGHTMKLLHNYVSLGFATVLAEAAAAAENSAVDANVFHDVLAKGGGAGVVLDRMAPYILNKDPGGLLFTLANSAKDLGYYAQMCSDLKTQSTVAEAVGATLTDQVQKGHGDAYVPQLINYLAGTD